MRTEDRNKDSDLERKGDKSFTNEANRNEANRNRDNDNQRNDNNSQSVNKGGLFGESYIDGENCDVNAEDLKQEKERIDRKYQESLEVLKRERMEQMNVYEDKVQVIHNDDHYKEDIYQEKVRQLREEQKAQSLEYNKKIARIQSEMETALNSLNNKENQLNEERDVQLRIIEDKVEEVKHEKMKYDELYRIQLGKIRLDNEYKEKMQQIKDERHENQEVHLARQEQLRKEKEYRESDFARNMEREKNAALIRLEEMEGYAVSDKDPDVRGWKVISKNGREVGTIDELIVDQDAMKVRYLDIDLNDDFLESGRDRHLLLPIGVAEIDENDDLVFIPGIDRALVSKIPAFDGNNLTRDYETTLINVLSDDRGSSPVRSDENIYEREDFNDSKFYRSRREKRDR